MKKTRILLLIVVLCLMTAACGKNKPIETQPVPETAAPTAAPTEAPTETPTEAPTEAPTEEPTEEPTEAPTEEPTEAPTEVPTEVPTEPAEVMTTGDLVAEFAKEQLEKPYLYGGAGPDEFDVSGLLYYCFREFDIKAPRTTKELAGFGEEVEKEDLLPGDALFFYSSEPGTVQYCGIYIGDNKFIAARNSEHPVSEMRLDSSYFAERYLFARRFWE